MNVKVQYSTESDVRDAGKPSTSFEVSFASLEAAKSAPLPPDCLSARIISNAGNWVYSKIFGWEPEAA